MSRTITLIATVGAALAVAAPASGQGQPVEPQWMQALEARSQELNRQHGLGEYSPAIRALKLRSEALNRQHGLGNYTSTPPDVFERAVAQSLQGGLGENTPPRVGEYATSLNEDMLARERATVATSPDVFERAVAQKLQGGHGETTPPRVGEYATSLNEDMLARGRATMATSPDAFERAVAARDTTGAIPVIDDGREIEWPQIGFGVGIGILLAAGLILGLRATRARPLAH
jgi:hypothetical protein